MPAHLVALVNGQLETVEVICQEKYVELQEPNGDPVVVNAKAVERVQHINPTRSRLHMANTANVVVEHSVADVLAALEA